MFRLKYATPSFTESVSKLECSYSSYTLRPSVQDAAPGEAQFRADGLGDAAGGGSNRLPHGVPQFLEKFKNYTIT